MALDQLVKKNIRALRISAGLSQKDLARRSGLSIRYISRLENEGGNLTLEVLERVAKGLDCPVAEMLRESKTQSTKKDADVLEQAIRLLKGLRSRVG